MVERLKESNDHSIGKASSESDNGYEEIAQSIFERAKSGELSDEAVIGEIWQMFLDSKKTISAEVRNKLINDFLDSLPEEREKELTSKDLQGESRLSRVVVEEINRAKRTQQLVKPASEAKSQEPKKKRGKVSRGMSKHIRTIKSQSHH